ncbi:hypothetical protein [uncultured Sulfitobacter sp.]|uniref:hypothetical protein n=1 Tax=uncultured Sulfitobacter sp. TaxID=191468 RepID=UPI002627AB30|nr:hypothetical protein [uncultured Sulfitobacter sp.]
MNTVSQHGLRILVGAGSFADARAALHLVRHLQGNFSAGLGGVLIEDVDMLNTCQIPDRRIILSSGTTARAPSLSKIRTLLQADARAFRHLLAQTAGPHDTNWAFSREAGELVSTALHAAQGWDVLVLGYRKAHSAPGKIVLLQTSAGSSEKITEAFRRLSKNMPDASITLSVGPDAPPNRQVSNSHYYETFPEAMAALSRTNARALLVDLDNSPLHDHNDLLRLLEAARCPIIIFHPSRMPALLAHSTQIPPTQQKQSGE